jgi:hypothetical protein
MDRIAIEKGQAHQKPAPRIATSNDSAFTNHRQACFAVLNSGLALNRREGQFLGGEACNDKPMSEKQTAWLAKLLDRAGLPSLAEGWQDD